MGGQVGRGFPALEAGGTSSSFFDHVSRSNPELLPFRTSMGPGQLPATPHGTTIVALSFAGGVLMAGDRRATMGSMIANRHIEKVFPADRHSVLGIAGTAGIAIDIVRLFQVELEHYEKIEGVRLSLEGKANYLARLVRRSRCFSRCLRALWTAIKLFVFAWNRRQMYKRRYPTYPVHVKDFVYP